jgi:hypothetical protein
MGRIMVAKTYMISQVTYLMGLLSLEEDICQILTDIIMGYVIGTDRAISRDRWFEPAECGG